MDDVTPSVKLKIQTKKKKQERKQQRRRGKKKNQKKISSVAINPNSEQGAIKNGAIFARFVEVKDDRYVRHDTYLDFLKPITHLEMT